jgi:hypothetical protein
MVIQFDLTLTSIKGIVSDLHVTIKFWMSQKCGKMNDYSKKMTTSAVE